MSIDLLLYHFVNKQVACALRRANLCFHDVSCILNWVHSHKRISVSRAGHAFQRVCRGDAPAMGLYEDYPRRWQEVYRFCSWLIISTSSKPQLRLSIYHPLTSVSLTIKKRLLQLLLLDYDRLGNLSPVLCSTEVMIH